MGKHRKILELLLLGQSDANISFNDLCSLLTALDFAERVRGSHHVFTRQSVNEILTLQRDGAKAKPYQVKQVRQLILRYKLGAEI